MVGILTGRVLLHLLASPSAPPFLTLLRAIYVSDDVKSKTRPHRSRDPSMGLPDGLFPRISYLPFVGSCGASVSRDTGRGAAGHAWALHWLHGTTDGWLAGLDAGWSSDRGVEAHEHRSSLARCCCRLLPLRLLGQVPKGTDYSSCTLGVY